jgi:hypothetical protein
MDVIKTCLFNGTNASEIKECGKGKIALHLRKKRGRRSAPLEIVDGKVARS